MRTLLLLLALCVTAGAQTPQVSDIVSRIGAMNDARNAALRQYSSTRTYEVSYKGFPKSLAAKAVVHLDYTAPDNKQFRIVSQEGSGLLIGRVIKKALESEQEAAKPEFHKRSALNDTNYEFQFVGNDTENN
ncbi:MAG TPA: hypothetical protein VG897_02730, partial [Terriglobales bacterium]|nr:hypothetical protein [Terriglobales bacterium]